MCHERRKGTCGAQLIWRRRINCGGGNVGEPDRNPLVNHHRIDREAVQIVVVLVKMMD